VLNRIFQKADFIEYQYNGVVYIADPDRRNILPPISKGGQFPVNVPVWADLGKYSPKGLKAKFLDYEYVYDPNSFIDLSGSKWKVFRKNIKKFSKRYHLKTFYRTDFNKQQIYNFVEEWADEIKWDEVQDAKVMLKYAYNGHNRKALINQDGKIIGLNIWDCNFKYINFRYCLCLNMPFLSEYMRYLFYTNITTSDITGGPVLVNDGGTLGNPGLKTFKNKLNPIKTRKVFSWKNLK